MAAGHAPARLISECGGEAVNHSPGEIVVPMTSPPIGSSFTFSVAKSPTPLLLTLISLLTAAHEFLGKPTLTDSTHSALRHFAVAALDDANATWKKNQYPSLIENALRQLIAVSPDYQTC